MFLKTTLMVIHTAIHMHGIALPIPGSGLSLQEGPAAPLSRQADKKATHLVHIHPQKLAHRPHGGPHSVKGARHEK